MDTETGNAGRMRLEAALRPLGDVVLRAEHPPVFTVEEAAAYPHGLPGAETKNLLLRDARAGLFLVTLRADRRADLKALAACLGAKRFSFASSETMAAVLGVTPGAVTPLALLNPAAASVTFVLDSALAGAERIVCHPLVNTESVSLPTGDLMRLLAEAGVTVRLVDPAAPGA